jgi:hypothetical protein
MLQSIPDKFHRYQATRRRVCKVMLKSSKHRRGQTFLPSIPSLIRNRPHISIATKIRVHSRVIRIWSPQKATQNLSACLSAQFRHQSALNALPIRLCSWTTSRSTLKTIPILFTRRSQQFTLPRNPFTFNFPSTAERT